MSGAKPQNPTLEMGLYRGPPGLHCHTPHYKTLVPPLAGWLAGVYRCLTLARLLDAQLLMADVRLLRSTDFSPAHSPAAYVSRLRPKFHGSSFLVASS